MVVVWDWRRQDGVCRNVGKGWNGEMSNRSFFFPFSPLKERVIPSKRTATTLCRSWKYYPLKINEIKCLIPYQVFNCHQNGKYFKWDKSFTPGLKIQFVVKELIYSDNSQPRRFNASKKYNLYQFIGITNISCKKSQKKDGRKRRWSSS